MSPGGGRPFWKRSERGTARRQHSQQRRARSRVLPRARRLRRPLPLRPSCGGPGGGGSCYRRRCRLRTHSRLRSFSSCAGDVSSVLFLYRAPLRFRARRCALATPSSAAQGSAPARPPDGDPGAVRGEPGRKADGQAAPCVFGSRTLPPTTGHASLSFFPKEETRGS